MLPIDLFTISSLLYQARARDCKKKFMLHSTEHEIYPADKY